jgi:hypothetical protein
MNLTQLAQLHETGTVPLSARIRVRRDTREVC